ncbi:J domain-containing protein [Anabaenopsis elenkinii]|uniref:DnaJ domain-containing protein n=1 Tax=Anabaenopsis elenkinii CCIBt3563 TaxID=2779889 RepID=A0A7U3NM46_9CYAN|nr:tetratricopeptide repeat protein [Anabaenopsis elenkinii]QOV21421.1 DnaJ domain-containing protein [Anabaenopsis elenkinii CCIBt3563]
MSDYLDINHAYEVLGLNPGASQEQVKQAYRQLVKIWHPDRFFNHEDKQEAESKIKEINLAYKKLKSEHLNTTSVPSASPTNLSIHQVNISIQRWDAETFYNWGVENASRGQYEEAIANFTQAISLNPRYIEAYKYRGFVCSQLGFEYRATSDLNKAASLERNVSRSPDSTYSRSSRLIFQRQSLLSRCCYQIKKLLRVNRRWR